MKKLLLTIITTLILIQSPTLVSAQGMMDNRTNSSSSGVSHDQTAISKQQEEEQEGEKLLNELKSNTASCQKLTDDNFEKIGEYYMGQMVGDTFRHIAMNNMMQSMMGQTGEEQAHIAMGKRMSGCDPNAPMPQNMTNSGMMSMMMQMVMGGGANPMIGYGGWNNMMGWGGLGLIGWVPMIAFWILLILGVIALIRYLGGGGRRGSSGYSPMDILKERYAKGEINKKEFEEMKKDLR